MLGIVVLAVIGIPKPLAMSKEGVGRVGWSPLLKNFGELRRGLQSRTLGVWLPEGRGLTASAPRRLVDFRLHVVSEPGERPQFANSLPRNVRGFYTHPDHSYAVFRSDEGGNEQYQLYRWDFENSEPFLLTSGDERASFGAFEPGGARIAYTSTRRNGSDSDIYLMDPTSPESDQKVLERAGSWFVSDWSPIAEELLIVRTISSIENEMYRFDLTSGEVTPVNDSLSGPTRAGAVQYSKDGQALYYSSDRHTEFRHLRRRELATGQESVLSAEIPWDVTSIQQSGDGTTVIFGVNEDGRTRYYVHHVGTSVVDRLELPLSGIYSIGLHPTLPLLRINHTDPVGVARGYVYDMESQELTLWLGVEPQESEVPEARLVRYPTFDSIAGEARTISAFVYPGSGEGARPVLIEIHGGPEGQSRLTTGYHLPQKLGVTVITPNVRGSTGYGRTFTTLDDGFRREDSVRDIGALLDWIEHQPDLDAARVLVSGGSYGGYMVLASLVSFGDRLRCGIDIVGISHFVTFLENTADYRRDLRRPEYGDERDPEMRAFLDSISPLNHADRIRSRVMILQGANDPRVPVGESRQFVEQLRANGIEVAYLEAANEGHGFANPWNAIYSGVAQMEMTLDCLLPDDAG